MPVSLEPTFDDRALTRYLLGQLAGEEADRLDELAIVDDDMAWRVRTVENDLVDAYVRGTLDAENRQHFETHYLASPKRRAKVRFAARFARAVDALGSPEQSPERRRGVFAPVAAPPPRERSGPRGMRGLDKGGWLDWLDRLVPRSASGWGFAYGAAALLLAITCGLLVMRDLRLGRALNESEQQRTALDRRTRELEDQLVEQRIDQRAAAAEANGALDQARAASNAPASRPSSSSPASPPASPSSSSSPKSTGSPVAAVALVLWPQTRGAGGSGTAAGAGAAVPAVAVPAGVDRVTLQLQLETPDFVRYSAALKESATNRIVWRGERLTAPAPDEPPMMSVAVPANLLTPQAYVLELTGYGAAGGGDVIGAYAFQVVRRQRQPE